MAARAACRRSAAAARPPEDQKLAWRIGRGPALLLADEPTGNLDHTTGESVIDYLFDEHARLGSALLLITHDPALAERCERRLDLADGRIIGERRTAGKAAARPVHHASF